MAQSQYDINLVKKICETARVKNQDLYSKTYSLSYPLEDGKTLDKQVRIVTLPLPPGKQEEALKHYNLTQEQSTDLYMAIAAIVNDEIQIQQDLIKKGIDKFKNNVLVFDQISRKRQSKSESTFYFISSPVQPLTRSQYISDNKTMVSCLLKVWRSLIQTAKLLNENGHHLTDVTLNDIVVDQNDRILCTHLKEPKTTQDNDILRQALSENSHASVKESGQVTLETDIYNATALIYSLFNGNETSDNINPDVHPAHVSETVATLMKGALQLQPDPDIVEKLYDEIQEYKNSPEKDSTIQLNLPVSEEETRAKFADLPIMTEASKPAAAGIAFATLPTGSDTEAEQETSKDGSLGKPSDPDEKTEEPSEAKENDSEEPEDPGSASEEKPTEKKGLAAKFKDKLPKKKKADAAKKNDEQKDAPVPIDPDKITTVAKKKDKGKKNLFDIKDKKKLIAPVALGAAVLLLVVGNIIATPDPNDGMSSVTEEEGSSFVADSSSDDDDETHYSTIEKADEEDEEDSDSVPSSSTYSDDDEDSGSSSSSDNEENENSDSSSETTTRMSRSPSNTSTSTSSESSSNSSSSNRSSSSSSSSSGSSSSSNGNSSRPSSSSSSSNKNSSSSNKVTTTRPNTNTSTTTTQTKEPEKPVVKPVTTLSVSPAKAEMRVGEKLTLTPTMSCVFSSDKSSVAIVEDGEIVAKEAGNCTITARGLDGQTYNIPVTVTD